MRDDRLDGRRAISAAALRGGPRDALRRLLGLAAVESDGSSRSARRLRALVGAAPCTPQHLRHGRATQPHACSDQSRRPSRAPDGRRRSRDDENLLSLLARHRVILPARARSICEAFHRPFREAMANARHLADGEIQPARNLVAAQTIGGQEHHAGPSDMSELRIRARDQRLELAALSLRESDALLPRHRRILPPNSCAQLIRNRAPMRALRIETRSLSERNTLLRCVHSNHTVTKRRIVYSITIS